MSNPFGVETITRNRWPLIPDGHNNLVRGAPPVPAAIGGCQVDPESGTENTTGRDLNVTRWVVYAPAGTDVRSTDTVTYRGLEYEVDTEPEQWSDPFGILGHTLIRLSRADG